MKDIEVNKTLIAKCSRNAILEAGNSAKIDEQEKDFARLLDKIRADLAVAEPNESSVEGQRTDERHFRSNSHKAPLNRPPSMQEPAAKQLPRQLRR